MKNILLSTSVFLCAVHSLAYDLNVGTNSYDFVFDDTHITSKQKDFIFKDLQYCFEGWGSTAKIKFYDTPEKTIGYLSNNIWNPYYICNKEFPKDLVTNENGKISFLITKSLSDAYTNAFVWAKTNLNIVVAANEFATFLSSSNFVNTASSNTIHNYILYEKETIIYEGVSLDTYKESFHDITNSLRKYTYYPPSVLGFQYNDNGPDPTNLWVLIPTTDNRTSEPKWDSMPAIWHDGKWKISFWGVRY